jgi:hypothetical protein
MTDNTSRRLLYISLSRASSSPSRTASKSSRIFALDNTGSFEVLTPQISTLFSAISEQLHYLNFVSPLFQ